MLGVGKLKTVGRVASLVLLLVATMGPWFMDSHPATEETCSPPLVWLGNGYCACLVSFMASLRMATWTGHSVLWLLCLPPALPFLSTLLLIVLGRERQWLWVCHLTAWGLVAIYSLFIHVFIWYWHRALILWGAGLSGVVAVAILVGEILVGKSPTLNESP
jgi:hypothetical protein